MSWQGYTEWRMLHQLKVHIPPIDHGKPHEEWTTTGPVDSHFV